MKIAWLTDQHGIFVDRDAWELALTLTRDFGPDAVPIGSDDIDFYRLSKFDKNPDRRETVQDELDFQLQRYVELKDAVDPYWNATRRPAGYVPVYHPTVLGNHNARFFRVMWDDPKFFKLSALEYRNLLGYDRFGFSWAGNPWNFAANQEWSPAPELTFVHGTKASRRPGYSVSNEMADRFYDSSLVMGHCHRGAAVLTRKPNGTQLLGIEGFCLCDLQPEYAQNVNWTQGVVFFTLHDDKPLEYDLIPFTRMHSRIYAYWRGQEYSVPITSTAY